MSPETHGTSLTYPRENARTQRYTLGRPRSFTIADDGRRVLFVRSASGTTPSGNLWILDLPNGTERLVVDAATLLSGGEDLSPAERARRERSRETAAGIVAYSIDEACARAVFALSGRLFCLDTTTDEVTELRVQQPVIDPRIDPTGQRVAYSSSGQLRIIDIATGVDSARANPEHVLQVWGLADFAASEELERSRGFWWSPDGSQLIVERFDDSAVEVRWICDPAQPQNEPIAQRYPQAGTPNSEVTLWLVDATGSQAPVPVAWDRQAFEYIVNVHWSQHGKPLLQVLNRRQDVSRILSIGADGTTELVREIRDDCWVDVTPGTPAWTPTGQLVTVEVVPSTDGSYYALCLDGLPTTPPGINVRSVLAVGPEAAVVQGNADPTERHVWLVRGSTAEPLTHEPGVHMATAAFTDTGLITVIVSHTLDSAVPTISVQGLSDQQASPRQAIASYAVVPNIEPNVSWLHARNLDVAVLFPRNHTAGQRVPVLLDPYGGPHFAQALKAQSWLRESQWFADQGFAVVVCDGRGTPRNPEWERQVRYDLCDVVLDDQVTALQIASEAFADLDTQRVAMRGWSFGGYLSAMAVLRRPDVFHAAVAGAPVTDYGLYDTAYTERYLGLPQEHPEAYQCASILDDATTLTRPLLLIHGFADDNVLVANTLQLSGRLMAAGKPHTVLPLSGVTHLTPQEEVAENLLLLQVEFLKRSLNGN